MINPHIKNQRTGVHSDIQNRSVHYLKLLETKPLVDNSWNKKEVKKPPPSSNFMRRSLEMSN